MSTADTPAGLEARHQDHAPETQSHDTSDTLAKWILLGVVAYLALWGTAIALFGVPGLYLPALALVPFVYLALVMLTAGK